MKFDYIDPKDFKPITFVFTKNGREFHECYKKYICLKCNTFEWHKATLNGINAIPKLPLKMPDFFLTSYLCAYVVSAKAKDVMTSVAREEATFFPIPNFNSNFVLMPNRMILPPDTMPLWQDEEAKGSPFCSSGPKCEVCGTYPEIYLTMRDFFVPNDVSFAGIYLGGSGMTLVASRMVSEELQKNKLNGICIRKNAFANKK